MREPRSLGELFAHLAGRGLVDEATVTQEAAAHFAPRTADEPTPWYIQALVGAGAWAASIVFLMFLFIAEILDRDESLGFLILGTLVLAGSIPWRRVAKGSFPVQLALSGILLGKALILTGVGVEASGIGAVAVAAVLLAATTYPVSRDPFDRFFTPLAANAFVLAWVIEDMSGDSLHVLLLAEALACGVLFTRPALPRGLFPLSYALAGAALMTTLIGMTVDGGLTAWWPSGVGLVPMLVALYAWAAGDARRLRTQPLATVCAATAVLAFSGPGILLTIGLMILGYAR
ncbi:MAG: DUF4401 domain-containing protein, partial [Planctomycetota bacterium]